MAVGLQSREVEGGLSCVSCLSLASSDIFMLERVEESSGLYWDIAQYCTALLCLFVCSVSVLNTGYSALVSTCSRQLSSDNVCLGWETRGRDVCTVVSPVLGTGCGAGCRDRSSLQSPTVSLLYSPQGGGGARHHSGQTVTWSPASQQSGPSRSRLLSHC